MTPDALGYRAALEEIAALRDGGSFTQATAAHIASAALEGAPAPTAAPTMARRSRAARMAKVAP